MVEFDDWARSSDASVADNIVITVTTITLSNGRNQSAQPLRRKTDEKRDTPTLRGLALSFIAKPHGKYRIGGGNSVFTRGAHQASIGWID